MGLTASVSWGTDDLTDAALGYGGVWWLGPEFIENTTKVRTPLISSGLTVVETREPVEDEGWGGSIAILHKPTGSRNSHELIGDRAPGEAIHQASLLRE